MVVGLALSIYAIILNQTEFMLVKPELGLSFVKDKLLT
jgi:hypothetical protein